VHQTASHSQHNKLWVIVVEEKDVVVGVVLSNALYLDGVVFVLMIILVW
jgi:hypothetical protein